MGFRIKKSAVNTYNMQELDLKYIEFQNNVIDDLKSGLVNSFDKILINGLKKKGFEFNHRSELNIFIKERCKCEQNNELNKRIYFVDNEPFLIHNYLSPFEFNLKKTKDGATIVADMGSYYYI